MWSIAKNPLGSVNKICIVLYVDWSLQMLIINLEFHMTWNPNTRRFFYPILRAMLCRELDEKREIGNIQSLGGTSVVPL